MELCYSRTIYFPQRIGSAMASLSLLFSWVLNCGPGKALLDPRLALNSRAAKEDLELKLLLLLSTFGKLGLQVRPSIPAPERQPSPRN